MKKLIIIILFFINYPVSAHHTKEHTMLLQNPEQVVATTLQGEVIPWSWLPWSILIIIIGFGLFKLLYKK